MEQHLLANLELFIACLSFIVIGGLAYFRKLYLGKLSDEQSRYSALESDKALLLERLEAQGEQCLNLHDELQSSRLQVVDLNRNNARLEAVIEERDRAMIQQREQFESQKKSLQSEFENLANRIFDEKGKRITKDNQLSIEGVLKPFREQITEFRHRVDGIQKENHESAGSLKKELEILRNLNAQMSQDAQNLTTALKGDKKTLGNWGEVQLERSLQVAGLVKDQHYRTQV
ncbi:DNA recombination protein RmuC, partial [Oleiphilus sp. HI0086]